MDAEKEKEITDRMQNEIRERVRDLMESIGVSMVVLTACDLDSTKAWTCGYGVRPLDRLVAAKVADAANAALASFYGRDAVKEDWVRDFRQGYSKALFDELRWACCELVELGNADQDVTPAMDRILAVLNTPAEAYQGEGTDATTPAT